MPQSFQNLANPKMFGFAHLLQESGASEMSKFTIAGELLLVVKQNIWETEYTGNFFFCRVRICVDAPGRVVSAVFESVESVPPPAQFPEGARLHKIQKDSPSPNNFAAVTDT